jgi:transposase
MQPTEKNSTQGYMGIDVSARTLVVAVAGAGPGWQVRELANTAAGHQQLQQMLRARAGRTRVCVEASGNYSLDVSLLLQRLPQVELSVINPRLVRRFAESLGERSKTDPVDARVLAEYAARMPRQPWTPPRAAALKLRGMTRAIDALVRTQTQGKNRQHALAASTALPQLVARELAKHEKYLRHRIEQLRKQARRVVEADRELQRQWRRLQSVPGIGEVSALAILGEIAALPPTLDARQWVAHSGLDPRHHRSGSSIEWQPRISRAGNPRLRAALYMPALVAVQHEPHLARFYQRLVARGKAKLQALTAVMRKLLHGIYAMLRHDEDYDGAKLCAA